MRYVTVLLAILTLSCTRDPNVAKTRYLENGDKYFQKAKYKEASIMYRNALQKDQKFGDAHYRLALSELKLGKYPEAVRSLRRAIELLPVQRPEHQDASVKLAELYLAASRDKQFLNEARGIADDLLKSDPNSFDGHRLRGELAFVNAQESERTGNRERIKGHLQSAISEFRKADASRPRQPSLWLPLARALAADGQYVEAEKLYRELIENDKSAGLPYTELYRLYLFQNKVSDAEGLLKAGIASNPKQHSLLTMLAAHYYNLQRRDEMVKVLDQMKSRGKEFPQAYLTAGDFYLRLGETAEAVRQYEAGLRDDSKQKVAYQKRIIEALMRQGKRAEAAKIADEILKDNPKDVDARGLKASLLLDQGEVQRAAIELQSVVSSAPENFVARFHLGRAHQARGELEQARQQFFEAVRLKPDYLQARIALGQLQLIRGEYEGALTTASEVLALDKQNASARLMQAVALKSQNKLAEARTILESQLKQTPNLPDALFQLALVNFQEGKAKEAEDAFRRSYQAEPTNTRGLVGVAEIMLAQNQPDAAIQLLEDELKKSPHSSELHVALGNVAMRAGKQDLALGHFQSGLEKLRDKNSKQAAAIYVRIGETQRLKSNFSAAIETLEKARKISPDDPVVLHTLAVSLDGADRKQEARRAYEHVLRVDPNNPVALNNLAFVMAETGGDLNQALTLAQRAKQKMPQLPEISDTLGWIYLKKNMSDSAVDIFRNLVSQQPQRSTFRYHLGMALSQKGDKARALKELEAALQSKPPKDEEGKIRDLIAKIG